MSSAEPDNQTDKKNNKQNTSVLKHSPEKTRELLWKMIKSKAKFQVFNAFEIYGRLSLTELAEKLHKSKSTIHSHVQFLLNLGLIEEEKIAVDTNTNVFENYYQLIENPQAIFDVIDFDFQPYTPLTREQIKLLLEPAISINKMMKSYFETEIQYFETMLENGVDDEAVETFNNSFLWVKSKDGKPTLLSRDINSFSFYSDREYFQELRKVFYDANRPIVDKKVLDELLPEEKERPEKKMLIVKSSIPYGYIIEYLNKQKHKAYQTNPNE